tara:strand:+ start:44152 stop:44553 length:402 start_codon:yes stop_codon:yes gene_type:complete
MNFENTLKNSGLRVTQPRIAILKFFNASNRSYSLPELEEKLKVNMDRATIYRNLLSLHKNGILHQVKDSNGVNKYIQTKRDIAGNHAHFICLNCGKLECLNNMLINTPNLPEGYVLKRQEYLVEGQCGHCANL